MRIILAIFFGCCTVICVGQHQEKVDFIHAQVTINLNPIEKKVTGNVAYNFKVKKQVDSIFLDAKNMELASVTLGGKKIKYAYDNNRLIIKKRFKASTRHTVEIAYETKPKQTVYFLGWEDEDPDNDQIWTQGQGKYTSHWLPSFDDMNEKVEFDVTLFFKEDYTVLSNGVLKERNTLEKGLNSWHFDMQHPMSSYLLAFAIGKYTRTDRVSASGIPLQLYSYPEDSIRIEPTFRYSKQIFDFLEHEIGVPYPWQNYKQVPVRDFLYAGMENTGTTLFSDAYVVDSIGFVDQNYVNINAHELAHQWFGDLVTEVDASHHWLHEGFATYYAYLAEKEIFGTDYFYWKLYHSAVALEQMSSDGKGEYLTNPKASSLTFYEKGAIALFMLKEEVGAPAFKEGVKHYLKQYKYKNVTVNSFITAVEKASGKELSNFKKVWLTGKTFPADDVFRALAVYLSLIHI